MSRLEKLRQLAAAQPDDPLTHYGVGLECMGLEQWPDALAAFDRTLAIDAQYSAAYLQKARTLLKLDRRAEAAAALQAGVAVAAARGETHAVSKMQELLETLG